MCDVVFEEGFEGGVGNGDGVIDEVDLGKRMVEVGGVRGNGG